MTHVEGTPCTQGTRGIPGIGGTSGTPGEGQVLRAHNDLLKKSELRCTTYKLLSIGK